MQLQQCPALLGQPAASPLPPVESYCQLVPSVLGKQVCLLASTVSTSPRIAALGVF